MKHLVLVFALASGTFCCAAQDSAQYRACSQKAKTQAQMNACASEESSRMDAKLDELYKTLLAKLAKQPEAISKIKAAEEAWIAYRDAYVDAMYPAQDKQAEYGTSYPMEVNLLRAELTRQQVTALKKLRRQHED